LPATPVVSSSARLLVPAEDAGRRLDQWLASRLPDVSRVRVQQLIEQDKISLEGRTPKASLRLRGGEEIAITGAAQPPPLKAFPENIPLQILYEDENLAVVNKPAGMMVHAGAGTEERRSRGTLVNALLYRFSQLSPLGGELRPGIVHRLDKATSGLLVAAKTEKAHRALAAQFSRREVKKTYIALVHGWMNGAQGTIDAPVSRDLVRRMRMTTRRAGREAITHWKTLEKIESVWGRFTLLEVKIETGRTHQIRVHFSSIGHPVAGDTLYGAPKSLRAAAGAAPGVAPPMLDRNFLHAFALRFAHPIQGRPLSFEQPLPLELRRFLGQIKGNGERRSGL